MSELIQLTVSNLPSIIKVIGVGGGGGNAVSQMYREGIDGVRFLVANTDSKALEDAIVPEKLQMGPGLGAGGRPALGQQYAEESVEKVREALDDETKMVFITAGMGGGTGTGASPVIAREAMKKGILTVGVVTLPFLTVLKPLAGKWTPYSSSTINGCATSTPRSTSSPASARPMKYSPWP